MPHATILRDGNRIVIDPSSSMITQLLAPILTYIEEVHLRGKERDRALAAGWPVVYSQSWQCYLLDHKNRVGTGLGFTERITERLTNNGYTVGMRDLRAHPDPVVYVPDCERVFNDPNIEWRYMQQEVLQTFIDHPYGRIDCTAGFGKSWAIGQACRLFPRAKIDILTRNVTVLKDTLYSDLCALGIDVGIRGGGMRVCDRRVMCLTFGSAHYGRPDADFVFVDESDQAAANDASKALGRYEYARMWGLSASHNMRGDGKELRCEGLFGPIRLQVPYCEGVEEGLIVPLTVRWSNVVMDVDPCALYRDEDQMRYGVWRNEYRNEQIAKDVRPYGRAIQTLIPVATLEHALALKQRQHLPGYTLVYNGDNVTERSLNYFYRQGLIGDDFRVLSNDRRKKITEAFKAGTLKNVIVTTVWNRGVNMKHLGVLVRADAGNGGVNSAQLPGRAVRLNPEGGKTDATVHDYLDQFNSKFKRKAQRRFTSYEALGYRQELPQRTQRPPVQQNYQAYEED